MTLASDKTDSSQKPSNSRPTTSQSIAPTLLRLPDLDLPVEADSNPVDETEKPEVMTSAATETVSVPEEGPRPNAFSAELAGLPSTLAEQDEEQDFEPTIKLSQTVVSEPASRSLEVGTANSVSSHSVASSADIASETMDAAESADGSGREFSLLGVLASRKALLCIIALIAAYAIFAPRSSEIQPHDIADGEQTAAEKAPLLAGKEAVPSKPSFEPIVEPTLVSPQVSSLSGPQSSQAFAQPPVVASDIAPTRQPLPSYASSGVQDNGTNEQGFQPTSQPTAASNPYVSGNLNGTDAQLASVASENQIPWGQSPEAASTMPSFPGGHESTADIQPTKPKLRSSTTPNAINGLLKYLPPSGPALPSSSTLPGGAASASPQQTTLQSQVASLAIPRSADSGAPTPDPVISARPNEPDFRFALPDSVGQSTSASSNESPNTASAPEARVAMPVEAFGNPSFR